MQQQSLLQPDRLPWEEPRPSESYREIGEILRRRWVVLVVTFLTVTIAGGVATKLKKPTYRATASLLVDGLSNNINAVDTANPLSVLLAPRPEQSVETQVRILESEQLQSKVQKKLGSLPRLIVTPVEKTNIVEIAAEGPDPVLVGKVPNLLLTAYMDQMAYDSVTDVRKARGITEKGANTSLQSMKEAEDALRNFKQSRKVPELSHSRDAVLSEVEALGTQYRETQATLASVQAEIAALKTRLHNTAATSSTVLSTESDPAIQETEKAIVQLQAQQAELAQRFEPTAPTTNQAELDVLFPNRYRGKATPLAEVDARLAVLQNRLAQQHQTFKSRNEQLNPAYSSLDRSLGDAQVRASSLSATAATVSRNLASALNRLGSFPAWELEVARLERTLTNARKDYEMYSQQRDKLRLWEQMPRTSSVIFQHSKTPDTPVSPNRKQNLLLSAGLGLFFGVLFILFLEYFDDRVNTKEQADHLSNVPNLGIIPHIKGSTLLRDLPALSPMTEAYRGLRTGINFAALDQMPQTIAVTSAQRGEGKSVTALNLATAMAMDGRRVILVDADLRAPVQHIFQNSDHEPGLTDLLIGTHKISEVLKPVSTSPNLMLIPAGTLPPNPAELLGSVMMADFIESVRELADTIVFDTPPILAISDAALLSSQVDATLLVVGAGEATRSDARYSLDLLQRARARVLGIVLNKVRGSIPNYNYHYGATASRPRILSHRRGKAIGSAAIWGTQVLNEKLEAGHNERFQLAFEERARLAASSAKGRLRPTETDEEEAIRSLSEDESLMPDTFRAVSETENR